MVHAPRSCKSEVPVLTHPGGPRSYHAEPSHADLDAEPLAESVADNLAEQPLVPHADLLAAVPLAPTLIAHTGFSHSIHSGWPNPIWGPDKEGPWPLSRGPPFRPSRFLDLSACAVLFVGNGRCLVLRVSATFRVGKNWGKFIFQNLHLASRWPRPSLEVVSFWVEVAPGVPSLGTPSFLRCFRLFCYSNTFPVKSFFGKR